MTPTERLAILQQGLTALEWAADNLRAMLPPPERDDPSLLGEIRDVEGLVSRLQMVIAIDGSDLKSTRARDALLSISFGQQDIEFARAVASNAKGRTQGRHPMPPDNAEALRAVAALLVRYDAGEFMPPNSFFTPPGAEA